MNRNTRSPYQHHPQSCQLQTTLRRSRNATKTQGVKSPRGVVVGVHVASSLGTSHSASTMTLSETQIPSMDLHGVKKRSRDGAAPAVPVNPSSSSLLSDTSDHDNELPVYTPFDMEPSFYGRPIVPPTRHRRQPPLRTNLLPYCSVPALSKTSQTAPLYQVDNLSELSLPSLSYGDQERPRNACNKALSKLGGLFAWVDQLQGPRKEFLERQRRVHRRCRS